MKKIYDEMLRLFAKQGEVIFATEIAPDCGRKYLADEFVSLGLQAAAFTRFPKLVSCGEKKFFVEQLTGAPEMVIAGGGHVALEVANIAKILGFVVTVVDERGEFANRERFKTADRVLCEDIAAGLQRSAGTNAYYVIVTRGHKDDLRALETVLAKKYRYVGMIGSKAKVAFAMEQLLEKGYSAEVLGTVHAPIGLAIGAITPAEIAVSILAEIIQELNRGVNDKQQVAILQEIAAASEPMAMVTIIEKKGSSPRGVGSKMLVTASGRIIGTIGGGMIEHRAAAEAAEIAAGGGAVIRDYDLSLQDASQLGMACGGTVKVLLECMER